MMVERENIIPDIARRLSKEAISSDLTSNKWVLLGFLYNMLARGGDMELDPGAEFHYITIGKGFLEVDKVQGVQAHHLPAEYGSYQVT